MALLDLFYGINTVPKFCLSVFLLLHVGSCHNCNTWRFATYVEFISSKHGRLSFFPCQDCLVLTHICVLLTYDTTSLH